jgi:predicted tellurium resistance membrane protein TerC
MTKIYQWIASFLFLPVIILALVALPFLITLLFNFINQYIGVIIIICGIIMFVGAGFMVHDWLYKDKN